MSPVRLLKQSQLTARSANPGMQIEAIEMTVEQLAKIGDNIRRRCAGADELQRLKNALVEITSDD